MSKTVHEKVKRKAHTGKDVATNSVCMKVERINLKVKPVECERLNHTQHGFAEESIDAEFLAALIQQSKHAGAEHQRDECARSLDSVLDVCAGEELECLFRPFEISFTKPSWRSLEENHDGLAEYVKKHSWPDESLLSWVFYVNTGNPESSREDIEHGIADH